MLTLRKETKCMDINVPLSLLRNLGDMIRGENFKISVLLSEVSSKAEILAIEPGHRHQPLYGIAVDRNKPQTHPLGTLHSNREFLSGG
ncbi:hypothetical protein SOV_25460 [Sporomusa ovata DSM 2662]|nr:hypothetical protein SOV_4c05260 [Sporomusa ovata DSM 2662]